MGFVMWVIFGALTGWLASMIMGTNEQQGAMTNILVGIVGSVVGGFVFSLFGGEGVSGFNLYSILVAVVGACILLWIVKSLRGKTS